MTYARQALGVDGEDTACRALERRGYRVLARRYRTRFGEIDMVARHGDCIVFVEVKTRQRWQLRRSGGGGDAEKQRRMTVMAADYLARHGSSDVAGRFDVVGIDTAARRRGWTSSWTRSGRAGSEPGLGERRAELLNRCPEWRAESGDRMCPSCGAIRSRAAVVIAARAAGAATSTSIR